MSTYTNKTIQAGRTRIEFCTPSRPSWKRWGTGRNLVDITVEHNGSLYIHAQERPDGTGHGKEVFVSFGPEATELLRQALNEKAAEQK